MYLTPLFNMQLQPGAKAPERAHPSDAGIDLFALDYNYMQMNERVLVKTGVHVEIPLGFVGLLVPRSSLSRKYITMTNSVGIIDSDYRGEIMASLMFNGDPNIHLSPGQICGTSIEKHDKIVQLVVVPIVLPRFNIVEDLSKTARGTGGFGSTGV